MSDGTDSRQYRDMATAPPERGANQLAADVRQAIRPRGPFMGETRLRQSERDKVDKSFAALDELVALVGTLTQEREVWNRAALTFREDKEAAEAALADTRKALAEITKALEGRSLIDYEHGKWRTAAIPERRAQELLALARRALAAGEGTAPNEEPCQICKGSDEIGHALGCSAAPSGLGRDENGGQFQGEAPTT